MIRALQAAFFLRFPVRGLGDVPLNLIGLACLGLLGFGNHGFWFAGLGVETLYLATLASNPRFQRYVNAQAHKQVTVDVEERRRALVAGLPQADKLALQRLMGKCERIESLWQSEGDLALQTSEHALRDLQWWYVKLLIARQHVLKSDSEANEAQLRTDIETIGQELADVRLSPAARESKQKTLALLKRRAENVARRRQTLDEIGSDLARIEAQVALVLENTTLDGKPQAISGDLELASRLLDDTIYGASAGDVAELDAAYASPARKVAQ